MEINSKGAYFTLDALFAMLILLVVFFTISNTESSRDSLNIETITYQKLSSISEDAIQLPAYEKFSDALDQSEIQYYLDNTVLEEEDINKTVLEIITILWSSGNLTDAKNLTKTYFDRIVPPEYGYSLKVVDDTEEVIYNTTNISTNLLTTSTRIISGLKKDMPKNGNIAKVSLTKANSQKSDTFFFGGYVGDGNISITSDIGQFSAILEVYMEADLGGPFNLYINNNNSGSYNSSNSSNLTMSSFIICNATINPNYCASVQENNTVSFNFTTSQKSFGGGFFRIKYISEEVPLTASSQEQIKKEVLPGIDGIINIFSSFYVPGQLNGLEANLHYRTDNRTIFLKIGNATVYENTTNAEELITINNSTISSVLNSSGMDYSYLSRTTVPFRIGLSGLDLITGRAIADAVSVVDVSGSMIGDPLEEAKNASKKFTDILLNTSGNRIGLVAYQSIISDIHELTTDKNSIYNIIDGLVASGGTCIGCGILEGTDVVNAPKYKELVPKKSTWTYTIDYPSTNPPDINGNNWTDLNYNESSWQSNNTILGFGPNADTSIINNNGSYYFRKKFSYDPNLYSDVQIFIRSDDSAQVYLNSYLIDNDTAPNSGKYWNRIIGGINPVFEDDFESGSLTSSSITLFEDEFESSLDNWTVTSGTLGSQLVLSNNCGAISGSNALVLRWGGGTVETKPQNLTNKQNVYVDYSFIQGWTSGSGSSCEKPESADDLYVEYFANDSTWKSLKTHDGASSDPPEGSWINYSIQIPQDGLHPNFKARYRYPSASGSNWDYWALDDFRITEKDSIWSVTSGSQGSEVVVSNICDSSSGSNALVLRWGGGTVETPKINTINLSNGKIVYSFRQGGDDGPTNNCENPESGENVYVEYFANDSIWKSLKTHNGAGTDPDQGIWQEYEFSIPQDGLHPNFKARYRYPSATGNDWDYWALDDFKVGEAMSLNISLLNNGNNQIAVKLLNENTSAAEFDLGVNATEIRQKYLVVMSDGEANVLTSMTNVPDHDNDSDVDAKDHTIEAACRANQNNNITVYTIGFGSGADTQTLNLTAQCGGGKYYFSDTGELESIFSNISDTILNASFIGQTIETEEDPDISKLFPDSYLLINYTPDNIREFGTFLLEQTSSQFGGNTSSPKNGTFFVPTGSKIIESTVTSYSSNYWTDRLLIYNGSDFEYVFKLWDYSSDYKDLGDPYKLYIPPDKLSNGTNLVQLNTALSQNSTQGGSPNNTVIVIAEVPGFVDLGGVFPKFSGGTKTFESEIGNFTIEAGDSNDTWDPSNDALDDAIERLMEKLDFDQNAKIDFFLESNDILIDSVQTGKVPWLFGPVKLVLEVWQ